MPKLNTNSKKGFTIIEVVLVLAIAGLIFMMVFIALPALQRSQRDTQRSNDMSRFISSLASYSTNNRGKIPSGLGNVTATEDASTGKVTAKDDTNSNNNWVGFYNNYLLAGNDTFEDPQGGPYQLQVVDCLAANTTATDGTKCSNQRNDVAFTNGGTQPTNSTAADASKNISASTGAQNYFVLVTVNARCNNDEVVYSKGSRNVAVAYKNEGGGAICRSNN